MDEISPFAPPHDLNAERALLGSMMLNNAVIPEILEKGVQPSSFYLEHHATIFGAMVRAHDQDTPVDFITTGSLLDARSALERVGGMGYLMELHDAIPTAANAPAYADVVVELSDLRRVIEAGQRAIGAAMERRPSTVVLGDLLGHVRAIQDRRREADLWTMRDLAERFRDRLNDPAKRVRGIKTGTMIFDLKIGGLSDALNVLSARTGEGKTTVAQWWSMGFAEQQPVLFVTSEVKADTLFERFLAMAARVKNQVFRRGTPEQIRAEWECISTGLSRLEGLPIWVLGMPEINLDRVYSAARKVEQKEQRAPVLVIDRLEKIEHQHRDEVTNIQRKMHLAKRLQMQMQTPMLLLCQLRKGDEQRDPDWRPSLDDLLGSSAIKQDAQMVVFLWRDNYWDDARPDGFGELLIRKHNDGPKGFVRVRWESEYPRLIEIDGRVG